MEPGGPKPRLMESSVVLATDDLGVMSNFQSKFVGRSLVLGSVKSPPSAVVCYRDLGSCDFYYTQLSGALLRESDSPGSDFAVGVVLSGCVHLVRFGEETTHGPGSVVLQLPGDEAVQFSSGFESLTVRIPITKGHMLAHLAMPYRVRAPRQRKLSEADEIEFAALALIVARETERAYRVRRGTPVEQFAVLGRALTDRAVSLLDQVLGTPRSEETEADEVCARALTLVRDANGTRKTVEEMAEAAQCSVRTLYRAFDDVAKIGPSEFEHRFRLFQARLDVLRRAIGDETPRTDQSTYGFPSVRSFRAAYLQEFGEVPAITARRRREVWEKFCRRLEAPKVTTSSPAYAPTGG